MERLIRKGELPVKSAAEIRASRLGIGFEKLDRAVFEPDKAYDLVAGIGVKYARIQSGWMRTEKQKGIYDFTWIDPIVDNLLARKVEPWINISYGNPLYTEVAKQFFGAVGCPPVSGEAFTAWLSYVRALVSHMKGRVYRYEIWNEPDIEYSWRIDGKVTGVKGTPNGREYGEFAAATARVIREACPEAYIIGFALGDVKRLSFVNEVMKNGVGDLIDAVSYHCYDPDILTRIRYHEAFAALVHSYRPDLDVIQGESGAQSRYSQAGALKRMNWTPEKQTKHLLRMTITDLALGCRIVSYFSAVDMVEALNGLLSEKKSFLDFGYFGVISADFNEEGVATGVYSKKPSYRALQNVASLFAEDPVRENIPYVYLSEPSSAVNGNDYAGTELMSFGFRLADGSRLLVYWRGTDLITGSYEGTATLIVATGKVPELIDLSDGTLYEIPEDMYCMQSGVVKLTHIPLRDYPLALLF